MNKLTNRMSSFFAGVMILAFAFVGAFSTPSTAEAYTHTITLRMGMSHPQVLSLQQALNSSGFLVSTVGAGAPGFETTYFGTRTHAAVRAFQSARGLAVDGIVGPVTGGALSGVVAVPPTTPNTGCLPGWLFNPLTGAPCTGVTPQPPSSGGLRGGAGSLDEADFVSSINNEEVGEGQDDVEVLGLDLGADNGSDLRILSVRVEFEEQGAGGSDDFDDYAEEVTIWFDGKQVGSTDVDDMSENDGVWSRSISLSSDAIVRRGETERMTVAVTAHGNIDSGDLGSSNNDWDVTVSSIRIEDAQGAIITESSLGDIGEARTFFFDTFRSANDVELSVTESSDNPVARTVQVDEDGGDEVVLLVGELEAEGSDLEITELATVITPTGASSEEIAARFILRIDGEEVDSRDADECTSETANCSNDDGTAATYVFNDFEFTLDEGDTVEFEIVAELNEFAGDFGQNDSLMASVDSDSIEAEDESGDDLSDNDKSGTATGEEQTFQSQGLSASLSSENATTQAAGENKVIGKYTFVLDIKANDSSFWIDEDGDVSVNASVSDADAQISSISLDSSNATLTANDNFRISDGQTRRFTVEVFVEMDAGESGSVRVTLDNIEYKTNDDDDPGADANLSLGSPIYRSGAVFLTTPQ